MNLKLTLERAHSTVVEEETPVSICCPTSRPVKCCATPKAFFDDELLLTVYNVIHSSTSFFIALVYKSAGVVDFLGDLLNAALLNLLHLSSINIFCVWLRS
jgi:hypothetical protein